MHSQESLLFAYGTQRAPDVLMLAHDRMPNWVNIMTVLAVDAWLDMSGKLSTTLRGLIGGILASGLMFGTARYFIDPAFFYGTDKVLIAIFSGAIGGLVGAVIAKRFTDRM